MSVLVSFSIFLGPDEITTWKSCFKVKILIKIQMCLSLNIGIVNVNVLFVHK